MNFGEQLVGAALQSIGYFVIQGLKVGVREADFLAIKNRDGKMEHFHIEVQMSYSPSGVLRAKSPYGNSVKEYQKAAEEFIEKKFFHPKLSKHIGKVLGTKNYKKVFVYGRLKEPRQLEIFKKKEIQCISLKELIDEASKSISKTYEFINFRNISDLWSS